jgi:DNA-directed RNA polymerase specialized sigma24 family protein
MTRETSMWTYLYRLWRSVLVGGPKREPPDPPPEDSSREALHEELRRLLEERETLQRTASCYREFGYEELAGRVRERLLAVDRRIGEVRLRLRRRTAATGR